MANAKTDTRVRNFATVVYPESAPSNFVEILSELMIPCLISPLHDKDINPDGTVKKAHYHVMLLFEGKKSLDQVQSIFDMVAGVGLEKVISTRGYARYLCHLDNPEKHQYDQAEVKAYGGADYVYLIGLITDKYKAIGEIIDYCKVNDIVSYSDLLEYARSERYDWFRVLCDNGTVVIREYLKSRSWTVKQNQFRQVDSETGELI